jgi:nucleoside-diphosphate-sugar epimerase
MARYGALTPPFTEDMKPEPVTPYGLAKHTSELMIKNLFRTHGGEYAIAVPHSIIGPRQRYSDPYRNVAAIMINRMLRASSRSFMVMAASCAVSVSSATCWRAWSAWARSQRPKVK